MSAQLVEFARLFFMFLGVLLAAMNVLAAAAAGLLSSRKVRPAVERAKRISMRVMAMDLS